MRLLLVARTQGQGLDHVALLPLPQSASQPSSTSLCSRCISARADWTSCRWRSRARQSAGSNFGSVPIPG